jgi:hypothetical protein
MTSVPGSVGTLPADVAIDGFVVVCAAAVVSEACALICAGAAVAGVAVAAAAASCDEAFGLATFVAGATAGADAGFAEATTFGACPLVPDHVRHTVDTAAMPITTSTATTAIAVRC